MSGGGDFCPAWHTVRGILFVGGFCPPVQKKGFCPDTEVRHWVGLLTREKKKSLNSVR